MDKAIIPEIIIYNYLKYFLDVLDKSIKLSSTQSIIEDVFSGILPIGKFDPIRESRSIFNKENSLRIKFGFNINTNELPAIHIVLPDEDMQWESIGFSTENIENDDNTYSELKDVNFKTNYSLIIVDKNGDSVVYIYHVLKYMFLAYHENLELDGFQTLKISGRDLLQQQGLIPIDIYSRNLSLGFVYNRQFAGLNRTKIAHSIIYRQQQIDIKKDINNLDVDSTLDENL